MPTRTTEYRTEAERLQYERAIAYVQERNRLGTTATPGTVLDTCELFALEWEREWLRENFATPSGAHRHGTRNVFGFSATLVEKY
ncbi:hypothetical protein R5W24_004265 [Gemmata sp. JC717]|uniref:hypothetical protein n=1 Tax=Gemmata algarum TaxID=2975278 RepID=UPI0021BB8549|nr:hypothetical protein [Gemmata algarum]MDY3555129.1 hypothetical protein [Gemmata algarum]